MVKYMEIVLYSRHHYPGSIVNGAVLVSVDKPKDYNKITVEISGFASTKWSEGGGNGGTTSGTFQNTFKYMGKKYLLWSKGRAPTGNLPVGEHSFPFSTQLPDNAPPSFRSCIGQVTYEIKARIAQDKIFKYDHHVKVYFNIASTVPTACMQPKVIDLDSNVTFCCCFNFGPVHVTCNLPRTGYILGGTIPLSMKVENLSKKIVYIRASLSKLEVYHSSSGRTKTVFHHNLSVLRLHEVPRGSQAELEGNCLNIRPTLPVSISNCSIIQVKYFIVLQAISSLGSSGRMEIPIVIANATNMLD